MKISYKLNVLIAGISFALLATNCSNNEPAGRESSQFGKKSITDETNDDASEKNTFEADPNRLNTTRSASEQLEQDQRDAMTCAEKDIIKEIEFIVNAQLADPASVRHLYSDEEEVIKIVKAIKDSSEDEDEIAAATIDNMPKPPYKNIKIGSDLIHIYKKPVQTVIPLPIFNISLGPASSSKATTVELDEKTAPLFIGTYYKQSFKVESDEKISELTKLSITKEDIHLQVTDLGETFTQASSNDLYNIDEIHRRFFQTIQIKINGILVYEDDDIDHVFSKHSGDVLTDDRADHDFGLTWSDFKFNTNTTFKKYLKSFEECQSESN